MNWKVLLLLIAAASLLSLQINKPFYGYHDWNGLTYGQIARNYVQYGPPQTRLGQVENLTPTTAAYFRYDTHYPPLFTLLLSIPVAIFGPHEWAIRLLPVLLSLLNLYLIFSLGKHLQDENTGVVAAFLALFTPIFVYFGKNPVHEVLTLTFLLLNTILFHKSLSQKKFPNKFFELLLISGLLSLFSGWPIYYHLPLVGLFGWLKTRQRIFLLFFLLPFLGLSLHLLHIRLLTGSFTGGGLLEIIKLRLSLDLPPTESYTFLQFLSRFFLYSRNMFTIPLLLTSILGFMFSRQKMYLLILSTGLLHPLIFSNIGYIHDYLQLPFLAFVALSSALFFKKLMPSGHFIVVGLIFSLLSFSTKFNFTKAMINSSMSQPEYDLVMKKIKPMSLGSSQIIPLAEALLLRGVVTPYYLQTEVEFIEGDSSSYQVIRGKDKLLIKPYASN